LMSDYNGLYQTNPKLSFVMMIALFSLAGIPPFAGFFSKFFIFSAAAQQGFYVLVFIALLNTIISLYYYLLVVKAMFINANEAPIETVTSDVPAKISFVLCTVGILVVGLISTFYNQIALLSFGI
jgi:NADH-quinone oxidoreductase subunit N